MPSRSASCSQVIGGGGGLVEVVRSGSVCANALRFQHRFHVAESFEVLVDGCQACSCCGDPDVTQPEVDELLCGRCPVVGPAKAGADLYLDPEGAGVASGFGDPLAELLDGWPPVVAAVERDVVEPPVGQTCGSS